MYDKSRINLVFSLLAFASICFNMIIVIFSPPAVSYEISIFDVYIPHYIFLLSLPISLGIIILVLIVAIKDESYYWLLGMFIIILANIVILFLPLFREYALYGRGDPLVHLGFIFDIIQKDAIGKSNFYPLSHILVAEIYYLSNMPLMRIMLIIPAIFNSLYLLGLYFLSKQISKDYYLPLIVTAFGSILLFTYYGSQFLPTSFSLMLIPLIIYLLIKSGSAGNNIVQYKILLVLTLYFISLFHPISIINLFIITLLLWFFSTASNKLGAKLNNSKISTINIFPIIILIGCFFTWFSQFSFFRGTVYILGNWFLHQLGTAPAEVYEQRIDEVSLSAFDFINYLFWGYGHEIVFFLISCIFFIYIIIKLIKKEINIFSYEIMFSLLFIIFIISTVIINIGALMINNPQRQFLYALMISTLLNGIMFLKLSNISPRKFFLFAICILIPCNIVGISSSYSSVLMGVVNSQVTHAEISGSLWLFDHGNYNVSSTYSINNEFHQFLYAALGRDFENEERISRLFKKSPPFFNITEQDPFYLTLSDYAKTKYTVYWSDSPEFPKMIFHKIDYFLGLNKIFDNDGVSFYYGTRSFD